MRALVQRVSTASVTVDDQVIGRIGKGFVILLGVTHTDSEVEAEWLARKVAGLRVFDDDEGKMNAALSDVDGELLIVSQFTLYGDARRGRRPSYTNAARPEQAEPLVAYFVDQLRGMGYNVATGLFGANMDVEIHNDGPVTLMVEREAPQ
jgi:D-tyrosyl-tRNA(Tyr) deacylase